MFIYGSLSLRLQTIQVLNASRMRNTDYLFKGYNIFKGDLAPSDGKIDPGFQAPIFRATWDQNKATTDGRFLIPDGYIISKVEGCSISMRSTLISGETSFQNTFGVELGIEGNFKGVKFAASSSFQNIYEETNKNSKSFLYSKADCRVWFGKMDPFIPPYFDYSFIEAVQSISRRKTTFNQNPNIYWNFINHFGTHYIFEANMGSRMGAISKTSTKQVERMMTNRVGFERSIGIQDVLEVTSKLSNKNVVASNFLKQMEDVKAFSIGAKPDIKLDPRAWAQHAIEEPMPITYKAKPIMDVFNEFGDISFNLKKQLLDTNTDFEFVRRNLQQAYDNYCQSYLLVRGEVRSCTEVSADKEIKPKAMSRITNQSWFYLQNMETETCITMMGHAHQAQDYVSLPCGAIHVNRQGFYFNFIHNYYAIAVKGYRECMDLAHGNNDDNGKINVWHCNSGDHQKFSVHLNENGSYTIRTIRGKCLQVQDDNRADHARIVQNSCNGMPGQEWRAINVKDHDSFDRNDFEGSQFSPEEKKAIAAKKLAEEQATAAKKLAEKQANERREQEEIANFLREHAEKQRLLEEQYANAQRLAQEQANAQRLAQEQANAQRLAQEQANAQRLAQEQANAQRLAQEQANAQRLTQEQANEQKQAREKYCQDSRLYCSRCFYIAGIKHSDAMSCYNHCMSPLTGTCQW